MVVNGKKTRLRKILTATLLLGPKNAVGDFGFRFYLKQHLRRLTPPRGGFAVSRPRPRQPHDEPLQASRLQSRRSDHIRTHGRVDRLIGQAPELPNIRLRSIPNVIPSELNRAADFPGFVRSVYTKMEDPFELLLEQLESPAEAIIADTFLPWADIPEKYPAGVAVDDVALGVLRVLPF